jgi:two-component system, sensor histidine kinase and response regulator
MSRDTIHIVDDSPTQLEALRALLVDAGYQVETARNGEEALARILAAPPDLVLTDVVMPGMGGYELCARIKEECAGNRDAPAVVLLTSLQDPRDIVRGLQCRADNYITKPYEPQHLLARIRSVLENRQLRRGRAEGEDVRVHFLGEEFTIASAPEQILQLLLASFEELTRTNRQLQDNRRELAEAHRRELVREQTARAEAEETARRMEQLVRQAEAATQHRDEVLAAVSHDLKNPLGTIYTSAALLLELPLDEEQRTRQLRIIRRTAERMNRLIQDLLDVSRMEAGRFAVDMTPERASSLVAEALEMLEPIAAARNVRIDTVGAPHDTLVLADRGGVLRVLSNLVGNALRFTPDGGAVAIRTEPHDDAVRFSVIDQGPGIPAEHLPRIFDRFWQAQRRGEGAGLGLAIAKGIVEAHGGTIWAETQEGDGARFHFTLPLAPRS